MIYNYKIKKEVVINNMGIVIIKNIGGRQRSRKSKSLEKEISRFWRWYKK